MSTYDWSKSGLELPEGTVVIYLGGNDSTVSGPPRWWHRLLNLLPRRRARR